MNKPINVAVVGSGYWGPNHIRNFKSLADCNMRIICDVNEKRLINIKNIYPEVETTTDINKIFHDPTIDAVVIATPVKTHFELAKISLTAGKHTLIEKPMTDSVDSSLQLIEIANKKDLILMVGHTFIYSSPVRKIKKIIESGEIGAIRYISCRRLNLGLFQKDINVTWDLAPHDLSIIQYLMADSVMYVNCQGKAHVHPNIEDVTNMSLYFSQGGFATIFNSWLDPNKVREIKIVGSKKMIIYDDTETLEKVKIYDKRVEVPPYYNTFAEFQFSYHYGDVHCPYIKQIEPLKVEAQHFLDCIKTGSKPESSGIEGLVVVQILEAASKSLQMDGGKVEIADYSGKNLFIETALSLQGEESNIIKFPTWKRPNAK